MATIPVTRSSTQTVVAMVASWEALRQGDDGAPAMGAQYTEKSVQVFGTFGGATLRFEGSNNGTHWSTLTDPQGNPLDFTTAKIEMVSEATVFVRPVITGGDGTTNLTCAVMMKE